MIELLGFILYIFAAFRITILLSKDNGPWDIFDWIRYKLGVRTKLDSQGNPIATSDKILGRIIKCPSCLSFYVLLVVIPLFSFNILIVNYIVYFLGCWGIVSLLVAIYDR